MNPTFEYDVNLARGDSRIPMKVRAATWDDARDALRATLPQLWLRETPDFRLNSIHQVPVEEQRLTDQISQLEGDCARLNEELNEARTAVEMATRDDEAFQQMQRGLGAFWDFLGGIGQPEPDVGGRTYETALEDIRKTVQDAMGIPDLDMKEN